MNEFRRNGDTRPVVYLDETWVNQNHTRRRIWQNEENTEGLKVSTGKGSRLIICHAGSPSFGFIKESKLIFQCNSGNKDYHSQMNTTIFENWFSQMLLNLEQPSIIVMDNASYHSSLIENYPKSNSRKADVQQWLRDKNIDFSPVETLDELREKVKPSMPRGKKYKLDELTFQMGHEMVRLPPYHYVETIVHKEIDAVSPEYWAKCGEHCVKIQEEDFAKAGLRDEILEPIILTINPDESSSNEDEDDNDD
ncbi:uncharacterized protein LOC112591881 [Melanaphis sacchari]|uniref:uncharacterized protein LOC112591881 n=1 Tax=Melanaphis sacchari TaxID=742174 RepID=UPI000DC136FA|nr:uncharacterized protein LOC112591881 [Melanaphis sacchari]